MSRTVSLTLRMAANAEHTGEIPVALVTISHPSLDTPYRFSSDPTARLSTDPLRYGTTSRGNSFDFLPMSLVLPDDTTDTPPAIKLVIDNIARDTVKTIRSVASKVVATVELVLASAPDAIEATWPEFDMVKADYDAATVALDLTVNALATEPYPADTLSPAAFPGLFR